MKHLITISIAALSLAVIGAALAAPMSGGEGFAVEWFTVDAGGGTSDGADFTLTGTVGQPDAGGPLAGADFTLVGGFWGGSGDASPPCPADSNGDSQVDVADLVAVISQWGVCGGSCTADATGDGMVDVADLVAVISSWGSCPE